MYEKKMTNVMINVNKGNVFLVDATYKAQILYLARVT